MQIEAPRLFEYAPHLPQPERHHKQIAFHAFRVRPARYVDHSVEVGVFLFE